MTTDVTYRPDRFALKSSAARLSSQYDYDVANVDKSWALRAPAHVIQCWTLGRPLGVPEKRLLEDSIGFADAKKGEPGEYELRIWASMLAQSLGHLGAARIQLATAAQLRRPLDPSRLAGADGANASAAIFLMTGEERLARSWARLGLKAPLWMRLAQVVVGAAGLGLLTTRDEAFAAALLAHGEVSDDVVLLLAAWAHRLRENSRTVLKESLSGFAGRVDSELFSSGTKADASARIFGVNWAKVEKGGGIAVELTVETNHQLSVGLDYMLSRIIEETGSYLDQVLEGNANCPPVPGARTKGALKKVLSAEGAKLDLVLNFRGEAVEVERAEFWRTLWNVAAMHLNERFDLNCEGRLRVLSNQAEQVI